MSEFYIGNVKIDGNLALGPMAGVTDMPFRMICKEFGADLLYTEMISAKGIYYKNKNTEPLWQIDDDGASGSIAAFWFRTGTYGGYGRADRIQKL